MDTEFSVIEVLSLVNDNLEIDQGVNVALICG